MSTRPSFRFAASVFVCAAGLILVASPASAGKDHCRTIQLDGSAGFTSTDTVTVRITDETGGTIIDQSCSVTVLADEAAEIFGQRLLNAWFIDKNRDTGYTTDADMGTVTRIGALPCGASSADIEAYWTKSNGKLKFPKKVCSNRVAQDAGLGGSSSCKTKFKFKEGKKGPQLDICCWETPDCKGDKWGKGSGAIPVNVQVFNTGVGPYYDPSSLPVGAGQDTDLVVDPISTTQAPHPELAACRGEINKRTAALSDAYMTALMDCHAEPPLDPADCNTVATTPDGLAGVQKDIDTFQEKIIGACEPVASPAELAFTECSAACAAEAPLFSDAECTEGTNIGSLCSAPGDCDAQVCTSVANIGDPCDGPVDCGGGTCGGACLAPLACVPDTTLCTTGDVGESCNADSECDSEVCTAGPTIGAECEEDADCGIGGVCGGDGICGGGCLSHALCTSNADCTDGIGICIGGGACLVSTCASDADCDSSVDAGDGSCVDAGDGACGNVCTAGLVGQPCKSNDDCGGGGVCGSWQGTVDCLACDARVATEEAAVELFGNDGSPVVIGDPPELTASQLACKAAIANASAALLKAQIKETTSCRKLVDKGKVGRSALDGQKCREFDRKGKRANAVQAFQNAVSAACTDADIAALNSCSGTLAGALDCTRDANNDAGRRSSDASEPESACGNGRRLQEECDDGNQTNGDGCSDECECEGICGDGSRNPLKVCGEICDDGNPQGGDGCEPDCSPTRCGDFTFDCDPLFPGLCLTIRAFQGGTVCTDNFDCDQATDCGGSGACPPACVAGNIGQACLTDTECDTFPGAGDGTCGPQVCYVGTCCGTPKCGPPGCTGNGIPTGGFTAGE